MTNVLGVFEGFDGPMAITGAFNDSSITVQTMAVVMSRLRLTTMIS